jgi:branched-chain amino acid transport system substrate-binding protein
MRRRSLLKITGGTTLLGSLAGCSALVPDQGGGNGGGAEDVSGGSGDGGGGTVGQTTGTESIPDDPVTIAMVTFTSGAGAVLGQPAANAAQMFADQLNQQGGVLGEREIEIQVVDEAGENTVRRFRELANNDDIDFVHGYISSADMLSVAPVAEDLNQLLMIMDAGSNALFEEAVTDPQYVFRDTSHAANGAVGAARLVARDLPEVGTVAGVNPDYAWGRDSMDLFESALNQLAPDIEIVSKEWPELFASDYGPFISSMLNEEPDFVYSSLWGGDLVTFNRQAQDRNVFEQAEAGYVTGTNAMTAMGNDMPEGTYVTGRGPGMPGILPYNPLHTQFVEEYASRFGNPPFGYTAFETWQGLKLYVTGVERAYESLGRYPSDEELIPVLEHTSVDSPQGKVSLANADGHQAVEPSVYAQVAHTDGEYPTFSNQSWFPVDQVNPPENLTTREWIDQFQAIR